MEDKSFLYLTNDDILSKINIDPRLIDSFKRVMEKMQDYFNANGYTSERNYQEFFEKYLLNSRKNNFKIYADKISEKNLLGFYCKSRNEIRIQENLLNSDNEILDHTLCHEYIHFIVHHSLESDKSEFEIYKGGFIDEALTEMLTQQIFPKYKSYDPQVSMQKFANILSGQINRYSQFLNGGIDVQRGSYAWNSYVSSVNKFQDEFKKNGNMSLNEAKTNPNYIDAQRKLIELFI